MKGYIEMGLTALARLASHPAPLAVRPSSSVGARFGALLPLLLAGLSVAGSVGVLYAGPVYRAAAAADLGWSLTTVAGGFAFGYLVALPTPILAGLAIDRWGPRAVLQIGAVISALGLFGAALVREPWHWYLTTGALLSVAYYAVSPAAQVVAAGGARRGLMLGLVVGLGCGAGLALGPSMAHILIVAVGWRAAFTVPGVALALLAVAWSMVGAPTTASRHATPRADPGHAERAASHAASIAAQADRANPARDASSSIDAARHASAPADADRRASAPTVAGRSGGTRRLLVPILFVGNALVAVFDEAVYQFLYPYGLRLGLSGTAAAGLLTVASVGFTIGMVGGGIASDRLGRRRVLLLAAIAIAASLGGLAHAAPPTLWLWVSIFGTALGATIAARSALWADLFAGPRLGRSVGILASGYPIGAAATTLGGAAWVDADGSFAAVFLVGTVAALGWAGIVAATRRP